MLQVEESFQELIERVCAGDQDAAEQFVRACEPHIQQAVRFPLRYYRLRPVLDSADISQSVLADFFRRKLAFRETLKTKAQCIRLLIRMARCKVMDEVRKNQAACRDQRRHVPHLAGELAELIDHRAPTADSATAAEELLREAYARLTARERFLAKLRADGLGWGAIARLYDSTPESVRKRFARAMRRVGYEMGLRAPGL